jgi:hypothetical protein
MHPTVFTELRFWLLIAVSVVVPFGIYAALLKKRAISRITVLFFGFVLIGIAGANVYLLQSLAVLAKFSPSLRDDAIFLSELSVALYLFPAMFGGIGINLVSHILVSHLQDAESKFRTEAPDR